MSDNRRRKLSFLGHGPPLPPEAGGEDVVLLDEEMDRGVWTEAEPRLLEPRLPMAAAAPRRDHAAPHPHPPPPYYNVAPGAGGDSDPGSAASPPLHFTSSDSEPQVSPRSDSVSAASSPRDDSARHVQFDSRDLPPEPESAPPDDSDADADAEARRLERHARHMHPHKSRKYSLQESGRGVAGPGTAGAAVAEEVVAEGEEPLPEVDRDDLRSHRGDDPRALRRHKIQAKVAGGAGPGEGDKPKPARSETVDSNHNNTFDHSPHSVFVQLDELLATEEGAAEWKETARWIKYEQDVEAGSTRWGRPHVASLSFHSLLNLRRCLEAGVVLLDLDERDLPGVAYRVVEAMAADGLIAEDDRPVVLRSLLLRHRHVHNDRPRFSISGGARKHSSYTSLQSVTEQKRRRSSILQAFSGSKKKCSLPTSDSGSVEVEYAAVSMAAAAADAVGSHEELRRAPHDPVMRRIPSDAEATTVLVGAVNFLAQPTIAFVRLARGIHMPAVTEVPVPVRFMFILLGPASAELDYHEVGRSISTLMSNGSFHDIAYRAEDRRELLSAINEFLDESIVLPPGDWDRSDLLPLDELRAKADLIRRRKRDALERRRASTLGAAGATLVDEKKALLDAEAAAAAALPLKDDLDDPLSKSGRAFGGVVRDIKRRYPFYISDFRDAVNGQCLAATIFMYFAALSSAITFGGLYAEKTHGEIGISETLVLTCAGGVVFALLAGQPLMITGATGPLLLLDSSLYAFCSAHGYDFHAARMYSGFWMVLIALCVASAEGSVAVKYITRFTEDIFAFLISLIFISEPITALVQVYRIHPLGADYGHQQPVGNVTTPVISVDPAPPYPNTALFCTILTLCTFALAYYLRIFRNGKFLGRSARRALGDFGVPLAIVVAVVVSALTPVWTERLRVPAGLTPTTPRSWLVPLNPGIETVSGWAALLMLLPACMVYIIVFMETHIAELIVAKPERKLKKGSGFHMDIVLMSMVNAMCGLTGAPWQCVATVRSVSHVAALTVMSTTHAPGDKPHVVEVKEQRVTGLLVAILVGLSALAARVLELVPMAVLFGVFLYMGISALGGIQFWDRCILLLKPVKHHPQVPYVRRVPTLKMHMYTLIQAAALAVLYVVKSSSLSLALPLFLVLCVPLRMSLVRCFTPLELRALDGAQNDIDKDDEPDFYEEAPLPG